MTTGASSLRFGDFHRPVAAKNSTSDSLSSSTRHPSAAQTRSGGEPDWYKVGWPGKPTAPTFVPNARDTSNFQSGYGVPDRRGSSALASASDCDSWTANHQHVQRPPQPKSAATTAQAARRVSMNPGRQIYDCNPSSAPQKDSFQSLHNPQSFGGFSNSSDSTTRASTLNRRAVEANSNLSVNGHSGSGFKLFDGLAESNSSGHLRDAPYNSWQESDNPYSPTDDRRKNSSNEYFGALPTASTHKPSLRPPPTTGSDSLYMQNRDKSPWNSASFFSPPSDRFSQSRQGPSITGQFDKRSAINTAERSSSEATAAFEKLDISRFDGADHAARRHMSAAATLSSALPASSRPSLSNHASATSRNPSSMISTDQSRMSLPESDFFTDPYARSNGKQFETHRHMPSTDGESYDAFTVLAPRRATEHRSTMPNGRELVPYQTRGGEQANQSNTLPNYALMDRTSPFAFQEQDQRIMQHHMQSYMAGQLRGHYAPGLYGFGVPPDFQVNGLTTYMPMPHIPPHLLPSVTPPKSLVDVDSGTNMRSTLLEHFKGNVKLSRNYELREIYDHICEFSGDQHGSRFIQQKLETANSDEKERVFRELQPNAIQLMTDVFGNYVIQKFFEHGDQNQKKVLAARMKNQVLALSLQVYGCRVVQKALEHVLLDQQINIVKELDGNVLKCVKDQNGNHVIQRVIERVPTEHIQFIVKAFYGQIPNLATHPYGCRVVQRLLEWTDDPIKSQIMQELHACAPMLIGDQYGNYVTQRIIQHGSSDDRGKIFAHVKENLMGYSKQKYASNVVEHCLSFGTDQERKEVVQKFCRKDHRGENALPGLIKDQYGNYVIQKLLDSLNEKDFNEFVEALAPEINKAKRLLPNNKHAEMVARKMQRYSTNGQPVFEENGASNGICLDQMNTPPLTADGDKSSLSSSGPSTADDTLPTHYQHSAKAPPEIDTV